MTIPANLKKRSKAYRSYRFLLFAILSLVGIIITFLPDQPRVAEANAEWILSPDLSSDNLQSAQKEQLKTSFWKGIPITCQASFAIFYIHYIGGSAAQATRRWAQQSQQDFFPDYFSLSHRSLYPSCEDEFSPLKMG